jgi:hypothetical protein
VVFRLDCPYQIISDTKQRSSELVIALARLKERRSVRLDVGGPVDMQTRSKSSHLPAQRIVFPGDDVEEEYSFPPGNQWAKFELAKLNVTFRHQEKYAIPSLMKKNRWDTAGFVSEDLKKRIIVVGWT